MTIYIEREAKHSGPYFVKQAEGHEGEIIDGPFDSYEDAEVALNKINPGGDDSYEENR